MAADSEGLTIDTWDGTAWRSWSVTSSMMMHVRRPIGMGDAVLDVLRTRVFGRSGYTRGMEATGATSGLDWTTPMAGELRWAWYVVVRYAAAPCGGTWLELESGAVVLVPAGAIQIGM